MQRFFFFQDKFGFSDVFFFLTNLGSQSELDRETKCSFYLFVLLALSRGLLDVFAYSKV